MSTSQYLENKLLNATLNATTYTSPTTVYLALYSTTGNATTAGTELTGNGYSRQTVAFSTATVGSVTNTGNVTFSATGNSWTALSSAVVDASSSGNVLYFVNIVPRTVAAGATLVYPVGSIAISMS